MGQSKELPCELRGELGVRGRDRVKIRVRVRVRVRVTARARVRVRAVPRSASPC
jgi:hypothetical protein